MAIYQNDPFGIGDYSNYASWKQVKMPDGQIYYEVPGNPGYVFDPVASRASGRQTFRKNPQLAITAQQEEQDRIKQVQEQESFNRSPAGQLLPVAGSTAGLIAAHQLMKPGESLADQVMRQELIKQGKLPADVASKAPSTTIQAPAQTPAQAAAAGAMNTQGAEIIGQNVDGSPIYATNTNVLPPGAEVTADGAIVDPATGATIGRVAQGALGAYQIYQGYNEFKDDKVGGSLGIASGAAQLGSAAGYESAGAFAAPLLTAKGAYDTYNSFQNGGEGIRSAATTTGAGIGSFAGPVGTVIGAAAGNTIGYGLQGNGIKNDIALAPLTFGASLIPGVGDAIRGGLIHKTTKQHQSERWQEMAKSDDPATAAYAQQYLDVIGQSDGSGPTFEDIQGRDGGGSGRDVWGASAFFDAFKDKGGWLNTTEAQREAIAKRALDEGLLTGSKGDIIAVNEDAQNRIKKIGDEVIGFDVKQTPATSAAQGATMQSTKLPTQEQMKNPSILGNGNQYKPYTPPNKDPNDPNTYGIDADGNVRGTLIGYTPQGQAPTTNLGGWANQKLGGAPFVQLSDPLLKANGLSLNTPPANDKMFIVGRDGPAPAIANTPAQTAAVEAMRRSSTLSPGIGKDGKPIIYRR